MSTITKRLRRLYRRQSPRQVEGTAASWCGVCPLEPRLLLSVSATFLDEILTITSDADDSIVVSDNAGNVAVNGVDLDVAGPVASADVVTLLVNGGPGDNSIDLSGVTQAAFAALTSVTAARSTTCSAAGPATISSPAWPAPTNSTAGPTMTCTSCPAAPTRSARPAAAIRSTSPSLSRA